MRRSSLGLKNSRTRRVSRRSSIPSRWLARDTHSLSDEPYHDIQSTDTVGSVRWYHYLFMDHVPAISRKALVNSELAPWQGEMSSSDGEWTDATPHRAIKLTVDQVAKFQWWRGVICVTFIVPYVALIMLAVHVNVGINSWTSMQTRYSHIFTHSESIAQRGFGLGYVLPLERLEAYTHIVETLYNAQKMCFINEYTDDIPNLLCDIEPLYVEPVMRQEDEYFKYCTQPVIDAMAKGTRSEFGKTPKILADIYTQYEVPDHFQLEGFIPVGDEYLGGVKQEAPPTLEQHPGEVRSTILNHHWDYLLGCHPKSLRVPFRYMWRSEGQELYCRATYAELRFESLSSNTPFSGVYEVKYTKQLLTGIVMALSGPKKIAIIGLSIIMMASFLILLRSFLIVNKRLLDPRTGIWTLVGDYCSSNNAVHRRIKKLSPLVERGLLTPMNVICETLMMYSFLITVAFTVYVLCKEGDNTLLKCDIGGQMLRPQYLTDEGGPRIDPIRVDKISILGYLVSASMEPALRVSLILINVLGWGTAHSLLLIPMMIWLIFIVFKVPVALKRIVMAVVLHGVGPLVMVGCLLLSLLISLAVFCTNTFPYIWCFSSIQRSLTTLASIAIEVNEPDIVQLADTDDNIVYLMIWMKLFKVMVTLLTIPLVITFMFNTLSDAATDSDIEKKFLSKLWNTLNIRETNTGLDPEIAHLVNYKSESA